MKKYIILFIAVAGLLVSCDIQIEDKFDENSSKRIDEQVSEAYDRITSAANGWVIEYFPNKDQAYGGVNILVKFNPDYTVEMLNETASDFTAVKKSTYKIDRYQSAVLAFDTYNEYISYYADPSVTEGEGSRYGFMGDLEFAIKSMSDTEIVMLGTKTLNKIVMRPIPSNVTWVNFLQDVQNMQKQKYNQSVTKFFFYVGDKMLEFMDDENFPLFHYEVMEENGEISSMVIPYIYTTTGIQFYEPLEILGVKIQHFNWDNEQIRYTCTDKGFESVYMQGQQEPYFRPYDYYIGDWIFYCSAGSYEISITEKEYGATMTLSGMTYNSSSNGFFDYPITLTWRRSGLVEIVCPQIIGKRDINYTGSSHPHGLYKDCDIVIRSTSNSSSSSTQNSGMISKKELNENPNRVDFENNGVNAAGTGIVLLYNVNGSYTTCVRWLEPMYMVKKQQISELGE